MASIIQGRIIWYPVADARGFNRYPRPLVVLTPNAALAVEPVAVGVVCSHTAALRSVQQRNWTPLPHHPRGMVKTKLRKPTVACCEWLAEFVPAEVKAGDCAGVVPPVVLAAILRMVMELHGSDPGFGAQP